MAPIRVAAFSPSVVWVGGILQDVTERVESEQALRESLDQAQCGGTLAYMAAWDVHHADLFDRVEHKTGIEPFGRLVDEVMAAEPYRSARRVFYFSIVQRKALTPNDFPNLQALTDRLTAFTRALPHDRAAVRVDLHPP